MSISRAQLLLMEARLAEGKKKKNAKPIPDPGVARKVTELERCLGDGALGAQEVQGAARGRILIHVTSIRRRLLDEDNLCEKFHVDLCRYAGIVPGDAPGQVKIETDQRKASKDEAERTVIEFTRLEP